MNKFQCNTFAGEYLSFLGCLFVISQLSLLLQVGSLWKEKNKNTDTHAITKNSALIRSHLLMGGELRDYFFLGLKSGFIFSSFHQSAAASRGVELHWWMLFLDILMPNSYILSLRLQQKSLWNILKDVFSCSYMALFIYKMKSSLKCNKC